MGKALEMDRSTQEDIENLGHSGGMNWSGVHSTPYIWVKPSPSLALVIEVCIGRAPSTHPQGRRAFGYVVYSKIVNLILLASPHPKKNSILDLFVGLPPHCRLLCLPVCIEILVFFDLPTSLLSE